jgi:site-specific recombinase XerD
MSIIPFPADRAAQRTLPNLSDLVADWLADLGVAGLAKLTRKRHGGELRRHGSWLDVEQLHWSRVEEEDLFAYVRLGAERKESTQANTIAALKGFYAWLVQHHYRTTSPAENLKAPRRPKPTPIALTRAQIRTLLSWLKSRCGLKARRDEMLVLTGLYTGLRAAELADLEWDAMDLDEGVLTIELSKMGHGRATALPRGLIVRLRAWQAEQEPSSAYVFGSLHNGAKISAERAGKIVRAVAKATKIPRLHTHRLRHTFATWTLRESKDFHAVSKALGHKELKQTEIYIAAALGVEQIAEAVNKLPGPDAW